MFLFAKLIALCNQRIYFQSNQVYVGTHCTCNLLNVIAVFYLTIDEATAYTGIGRDKLYEMTSQEKCPFVLWVGNRRMIKRRVFDEYIEKMYSI